MASFLYRVTPAQIGNSSGLRLPAAFYRVHPEFSGAPGQKAMPAEDDELFTRQYEQLKAEVKRLKQELDQQSFLQHPQVKLLALPSRVRCGAMDGSRGWVCQATSKTEPLPTPKTEPPRNGLWTR
jgi:hypothetical protein